MADASSPSASAERRPPPEERQLDPGWMAGLFCDKDEGKRAAWLRTLQSSGCATRRALTQLDARAWRELGASPRTLVAIVTPAQMPCWMADSSWSLRAQ